MANNRRKGEMSCIQETNLMLEEMLKEPDINGKIEELEDSLEEARDAEEAAEEAAKKGAQTSSKGKTSREAKTQKAQEMRDKRKAAEEATGKRKDIERRLSFYKAFREHKSEILNLREYQLSLQSKLDQLEAKKQRIESREEMMNDFNQEIDALDYELSKLLLEINDKEQKLRDPDLSDEEREQINSEISDLRSQVDSKHESRRIVVYKSNMLMNVGAQDKNKIKMDIAKTKIAISKTSLVWRNLLKGRNWGQIEIALSEMNFIGMKGTVDRIEDLGEMTRTQRNVPAQEQGTIQNPSQATNQAPSQPTNQVLNQAPDQAPSQNSGEANNDRVGAKPTPPSEYRSYKEEHRILSRIPFWGKYMEQQRQQEYEQVVAEYAQRLDEYEQAKEIYDRRQKREKQKKEDFSYLTDRLARNDRGEQDTKQVDVLKNIAKKGRGRINEIVRVDQRTLINLKRVAEAHARSEGSGGRAEGTSGEREPGDD